MRKSLGMGLGWLVGVERSVSKDDRQQESLISEKGEKGDTKED